MSWSSHLANFNRDVFFAVRKKAVGIDKLLPDRSADPLPTEAERFWQ
ncbi:MAG: hypothetical protein ACRDRE_03705 [Pseudonocardiaceae bacterium]